ncbi:MAG: AAA family ATPase [Candidatus Omnitrophica bacterium]|nr:AAA family ATPase [Candidatus Omnitrophota bacterium]
MQKLKVIDGVDMLNYNVPSREMLLLPWLSGESINLLYAKRGVGKTQMALGLSAAVATQTSFLNWEAPSAQKVLYVDGEVPISELKKRVCRLQNSGRKLRILNGSIQCFGMPNIRTTEGQDWLETVVCKDTKLIVIDNLSCLVGGNENDAESWDNIGEWAMRKRSQGVSVLFVHHAGKEGQQRGTSRREDLMDCIISLKHPKDYEAKQGARFEVRFEKARFLSGTEATPFTVNLKTEKGKDIWNIEENPTQKEKRAILLQKVAQLLEEGRSNTEIAIVLKRSRKHIWELSNKINSQHPLPNVVTKKPPTPPW